MNLFIKTVFLILVHLTLFQTSYANDIRRKLECRKDSTENLKKYSQIISDTVIKIVNTKSLPDSLTGDIEIVFDISDSGNIENVILEKGVLKEKDNILWHIQERYYYNWRNILINAPGFVLSILDTIKNINFNEAAVFTSSGEPCFVVLRLSIHLDLIKSKNNPPEIGLYLIHYGVVDNTPNIILE